LSDVFYVFRSKAITFESQMGVSTEKEKTSKSAIDFYKKEIKNQVLSLAPGHQL
jgi:hypothetical protein